MHNTIQEGHVLSHSTCDIYVPTYLVIHVGIKLCELYYNLYIVVYITGKYFIIS